jgi:hypothetical protein
MICARSEIVSLLFCFAQSKLSVKWYKYEQTTSIAHRGVKKSALILKTIHYLKYAKSSATKEVITIVCPNRCTRGQVQSVAFKQMLMTALCKYSTKDHS